MDDGGASVVIHVRVYLVDVCLYSLFDILSEMVSTFQSPVAVCVFFSLLFAFSKVPSIKIEVAVVVYIFVYDFLRKGIVGSFQSIRFIIGTILQVMHVIVSVCVWILFEKTQEPEGFIV